MGALTTTGASDAPANSIVDELRGLREDMVKAERDHSTSIERASPSWRDSARNLIHYVAMRRRDLRSTQHALATLGLSSIGRAESAALASINAVIRALDAIAGIKADDADPQAPVSIDRGATRLREHTDTLLGPAAPGHAGRVMVTMPTEAAHDPNLVRDLLESGMSIMRINSAHDDEDAWRSMIANLRRAERELERPCRVYFDLAGPKLRTGPIEPGPRVVAWYPKKDPMGRMISPSHLWLRPEDRATAPERGAPDAEIPLPRAFVAALREGDVLRFHDARGKSRALRVMGCGEGGCWAESVEGTFVTPGTAVSLAEPGDRPRHAVVGDLPAVESSLVLRPGDEIILTRDQAPGHPARYDPDGALVRVATVPCTLPQVFTDVAVGHAIWFDDGKIGGGVREVADDWIRAEVTQCRPRGRRLRADKGINLPDTVLDLPVLTERDLGSLRFAVQHADAVGLSFVRSPGDVELLQTKLADLGGDHLGIVLKIETRQGFERLPAILLAAMRSAGVGVMIARGDLAVECGFERLAEVQEEILWLCEAAHVPVIWATQVLETLAKKGQPTRAEITDAAMSVRAECVMLNKGPYITRAVRMLDSILGRMADHQSKKRPMLRPLRVAEALA
jgi:pyruvate kinase